jgi:hypothetical protein
MDFNNYDFKNKFQRKDYGNENEYKDDYKNLQKKEKEMEMEKEKEKEKQIESISITESNYNPIKLNEVSNNNKRFQNFDSKNKYISINENEVIDRPNIENKFKNKIDDKIINNDFKLLDKLKNKIKDLESKIGEINNGKNKNFIFKNK